jgi:hypothetical protein
MPCPEAINAARAMAKCVFEANADEANRARKPHVARSELLLISMVDSGELDDGLTIQILIKEWE